MYSNRILPGINLKFRLVSLIKREFYVIFCFDNSFTFSINHKLPILFNTFSTGGVTLNSLSFSVKSSILNVADIITNFKGLPFCNETLLVHLDDIKYRLLRYTGELKVCDCLRHCDRLSPNFHTFCLSGTILDNNPIRISV